MAGTGSGLLGATSMVSMVGDRHLARGVHTHVVGERGLRSPAGRSSRRADLFHHSVDLFEGEAFGLPDHGVGIDEAQDAGRAPHEEDLGLKVRLILADEVWRDDLIQSATSGMGAATGRG